jgi:hypothetical protein
MTNNVFSVLMVVIGLGLFEAQTSAAADVAPSGAAAFATVQVRSVQPGRISESARREVLALVQRNDLGRDTSMLGVRFAQGGTSRKRHSIYFPIKVGAGVGCASGATLAYLIWPYTGDPGVRPGPTTAMVESCVVVGLIGAGIGYLIAAH